MYMQWNDQWVFLTDVTFAHGVQLQKKRVKQWWHTLLAQLEDGMEVMYCRVFSDCIHKHPSIYMGAHELKLFDNEALGSWYRVSFLCPGAVGALTQFDTKDWQAMKYFKSDWCVEFLLSLNSYQSILILILFQCHHVMAHVPFTPLYSVWHSSGMICFVLTTVGGTIGARKSYCQTKNIVFRGLC